MKTAKVIQIQVTPETDKTREAVTALRADGTIWQTWRIGEVWHAWVEVKAGAA